jgi:hypothetical protein
MCWVGAVKNSRWQRLMIPLARLTIRGGASYSAIELQLLEEAWVKVTVMIDAITTS